MKRIFGCILEIGEEKLGGAESGAAPVYVIGENTKLKVFEALLKVLDGSCMVLIVDTLSSSNFQIIPPPDMN